MFDINDLLEKDNHQLERMIEIALGYARKSRFNKSSSKIEDELERIENDLEGQVMRLEDFFEKKTWSYELFKEVKSGENIEDRDVFNEVLKIIRSGEIDALVVVDFDRLTRGSNKDRDLVITTLREGCVVLVEEVSNRLYNPYNDSDIMQLNMKGFVANVEYNQIVTRNKMGKRIGAKKGNHVSGIPPYGYKRNDEEKKFEVDKETAEIYRSYMVEPFLQGVTISEIAWNLNKDKIPSPREKMWKETTIRNILKNEIYTGTMIYNKTRGSRNSRPSINKEPYRKMDRDRWIISPNAHTPLVTKQEFEAIQLQFKVRGKVQETKQFHPLSGMVKCFYCGETLKIQKEVLEKGEIKHRLCKCECGKTSGGYCDLVLASIYQGIEVLESRIRNYINNSNSTENELEAKSILRKINDLEKQIVKREKAIKKVEEDYQMGDYTKQEKKMYIDSHNEVIQKLTKETIELQKKLKDISLVNNNDKLDRIQAFKEDIKKVDNTNFYDLRKLLLSIIRRVVWKRDLNEDVVDVKVNFL